MEFTGRLREESEVQDMMDRVETAVDSSFDALGRNRYMSVIEVHLRNGAVIKREIAGDCPRKSGNPLNRETCWRSFNDCVQETLGGDQARELVATVDP